MWNYISPLVLGIIVGAIFKLFKQPVPAPSTITGILGILGLYLGYILMR